MAASSQPLNWCPVQPALNHDSLATDAGCPFCHSSGNSVQLPTRPATVTPATQEAPAQYTPVAPGAVNAQLRASVLARGTGVSAATTYRNQAMKRAQIEVPSSPKIPAPFLFTVKVAWATYADADPPTTTRQRFNEYTTVAISHNACISFDIMKDTFRQQLQAQPAPYFSMITGPKAHGHWTIASNHLTATGANVQPNLITLWPGEFRIQDIISLTNWRLDKGVYPATLLFYPNLPSEKDDSDKISFHSSSVAFGDDSVIPRGRERGWREPKPPTPSPTFEPFTDLDDVPPQAPIDSVKRKGKGPHKRTISAAIQGTAEVVAVDGGLRKSARQRKMGEETG